MSRNLNLSPDRLARFWEALPSRARLFSSWLPSRRFAELTYVREDLVGSYKGRKYLSLLPWMVQQGFRRVRLRGSSHSSNVLHLSLLLKQVGLQPVYVLEGREGPPVGNGLLSRLALGEDFKGEDPRESFDWEVPEGGSCPAALAGSLGLVGSLMEGALSAGGGPFHIYIDSGTGFTAAALLLGLGFFGVDWPVTVVSMTRQEKGEIEALVACLHNEYERLFGEAPRPVEFQLVLPPTAQSFGSTNGAVFAEVQSLAREEGLLCDPLYAAKLSLTYRELRDPAVKSLMFVSGGERELLGFQKPLRDFLCGT